MRWYIASRMKKEKIIKEINIFLKTKNQEISYEWPNIGSIKPYKENSKKASTIAKEISEALKKTDIFILISDKEGTDMFIELGIMLGKPSTNRNQKIYIIGNEKDRSLMHFHPLIKKENTLKEVIIKELSNSLNQNDLKTIEKLDKELNNNS